MKTKSISITAALLLLAGGLPARAATNDLSSALQQGLFEEEANRNLPAAIAAYQALAKQFDKDRALAATAVFRLGECYRKQGQTNEAAAQYQRLLRNFADQSQLVTLSRQNLAGMGVAWTVPAAPTAALSPAARQEQAKLLDAQIQLAEQDVADLKKQFEVGRATQADIRAKEREVLSLRQQLAALDAQPPGEASSPSLANSAADQANLLSAQISGIEKLKDEPEKQAQAVLALYPDEDLKKMLLHLPKLQEQAARFKADPNLKLDMAVEGFAVAIGPGGRGIHTLERGTVNDATRGLTEAQAEVKDQLTRISERVDFILGLQKARLQVLQSVAGAGAAAKGGVTTVVIDPEETEIRKLQDMIRNSPDLINAPSGGEGDNFTPLGRAANAGQLRVAGFLLNQGADVSRKNPNGKTALQLAAAGGHKAMVDLLLSRGAAVDARDNNGWTALYDVAGRGFKAVAETLLAHQADANARAADGGTPLHRAADPGDPAMIALLLSHGADVNAVDENGRTPLIIAAVKRQNSATIKALLAAKANPDVVDKSGETALVYAALRGEVDSVKALLAGKANPNAGQFTPLLLAIHAGNSDIVRVLLEAGADANQAGPVNWQLRVGNSFYGTGPDRVSVTPLFLAINEGKAEIAKLLLQHKADPNGVGPDRLPVLLSATSQPDTLAALLAAGAKPNVEDGEGRTPLFTAAANGQAVAVAILAEHGANTEVRPLGMTPLLVAADHRDQKTAEALLKAGADVNARATETGYTPLHIAVLYKDAPMVQLLIANKADVNARDNNGFTPLDLASGKQATSGPGLARPGLPPFARPPLGMPGQAVTAPPAATASSLVELLREHGGLGDLPKLDRIQLRRASANFSDTVFQLTTNDWCRFSLLELIAAHYGLVSDQRSGEPRPRTASLQELWGNTLRFPDLAHVVIYRPAADGKERTAIPVNVAEMLRSGDCAKDVALRGGDVVELPEADHPVSEPWHGLTDADMAALIKCLTRTVTIAINGTNATFKLAPEYLGPQPTGPLVRFGSQWVPPGQAGRTTAAFMLRSVLDQSKLIRYSSDLTRVKVTRRDAAGGQARSWVLNCSDPNQAPDFWLRDGDTIEVPEK